MSLRPSTCAMMQVPSSSFTVWSWTQPSPVHIPHIGVSYTEANQLEQTPVRSIESTALLTESAEKKSHSDHFFFFSCVQVPLHTWFQPITNEKRRQKKKREWAKEMCQSHANTNTNTVTIMFWNGFGAWSFCSILWNCLWQESWCTGQDQQNCSPVKSASTKSF